MTRIYHDDGGGITKLSLEVLERLLKRDDWWRIQWEEVRICEGGVYKFELSGWWGEEQIVVLLSGLSCGYGGEGPHGSVEALERLGFKFDENKIFHEGLVVLRKRDQ